MQRKPTSLAAIAASALLLCSCATTNSDLTVADESDSAATTATAADLVPESDSEQIAESLKDCRYDDALAASLKEKMYGVSNYIAECVMETNELIDFVEKNYPDAPKESMPNENDAGEIGCDSDEIANEIRYTLARRLMRENRPQESRKYFPQELIPIFDAYVEAIRRGYNFNSDDFSRARGFWDAAMIVRGNGDALFSLFSVPEFVAEKNFATEDERERVLSRGITEPVSTIRLRAATLARYAAGLLPNNDERTARLLFTAGVWLKARDPEAADDFYKMLAIRCPKTEVGKRCLDLRWFPADVPWTREQAWDGVPAIPEAKAHAEADGE